jgi:hypothetical protein
VQESAVRAVDQGRRFIQLELPHVAQTQVELDVRLRRAGARLLQHRRRRVHADHLPTGRPSDRDRHATVPDRELDERTIRLACEPDVERNILRHVGGPRVVVERERLVPAHRLMLPTRPSEVITD